MHLNPYGEYAVLLAQSLADDWPADHAGIVARTREFGMTIPFPEQAETMIGVVRSWTAGWRWWMHPPLTSVPRC